MVAAHGRNQNGNRHENTDEILTQSRKDAKKRPVTSIIPLSSLAALRLRARHLNGGVLRVFAPRQITLASKSVTRLPHIPHPHFEVVGRPNCSPVSPKQGSRHEETGSLSGAGERRALTFSTCFLRNRYTDGRTPVSEKQGYSFRFRTIRASDPQSRCPSSLRGAQNHGKLRSPAGQPGIGGAECEDFGRGVDAMLRITGRFGEPVLHRC